MATLPIHTVQHLKSVYNKYQVVAVVFTAMTLLAALLAAVSGFQLAKLRKIEAVETQSPPAPVDAGLEKQIKVLEDQLQSEKSISRELRDKVNQLEKRIASMRVETPPRTEPVQPADAGKTVAAPLKTISPSVPPASSEIPQKKLQTGKTPSQVQTELPAPETGSAMSDVPSEEPKPSGSQTPTQPAAPAMEKDQSITESVTTPAADRSPADISHPKIPSEGAHQAAPNKAEDENAKPIESSIQPSVDSGSQSPTDAKP